MWCVGRLLLRTACPPRTYHLSLRTYPRPLKCTPLSSRLLPPLKPSLPRFFFLQSLLFFSTRIYLLSVPAGSRRLSAPSDLRLPASDHGVNYCWDWTLGPLQECFQKQNSRSTQGYGGGYVAERLGEDPTETPRPPPLPKKHASSRYFR